MTVMPQRIGQCGEYVVISAVGNNVIIISWFSLDLDFEAG